MRFRSIVAWCCALTLIPSIPQAAVAPTPQPVPRPTAPIASNAPVRAVLSNGLKVVLLPDRLAPVATTVITYDVGSDRETMPGLAHATEHMMFRGTKAVSAGQFADIATRAGAEYDAQTTNFNTLYYFKLPSAYVPIALRLEADRMNGALMSPAAWKTERGAIEQEIRGDESVPGWAIGQKLTRAFFGDTPYGTFAGGTIASFQKMTAADIAAFYHTWYHPNDATIVVAGDIDPVATLAQIHELFDPIPSAPLPQSTPIAVPSPSTQAIDAGVSELPVPLAADIYRFPSLDDPDYAAGQVLMQALDNGTGALAELTVRGTTLGAYATASAYPEVGIAEIAAIGLPSSPPESLQRALLGVISGYARSGVPPELVEAAKTRLLSQQAYRQASISGLAFAWVNALATGRPSPDDIYGSIARVTDADVNRVLRTYLQANAALPVTLRPKASASRPKVDPNAGQENVKYTPDVHRPLPAWTTAYFNAPLRAPKNGDLSITKLPNGLQLTVRQATFSPVVVLRGHIRNSPHLYEPWGKSGVAAITSTLLPWGTQTYDRAAYQEQRDAIAASVSLGTSFSLEVPAKNFDRAVALLADGMLHPAFPPSAFDVIERDDVQAAAALEKQPTTQASVARTDALYPLGDPRRRRATAQTIAAITPNDVRKYYAFAYRPDLTTIAIVGDVTPKQAHATIVKYFGAWKAVGKKPSFRFPQVATSGKKSVTVTSAASRQSQVTLTQVIGVRSGSFDAVALDLANTILSGEDTGSMLFRDVRTNKGYVYSIDSSVDVGESSSTFSIDFASDPKNAARAQTAAVAVIQHLRTTPLPLVELQRAKALLLAQRVLPLDSYSGLADDLLQAATYGYTRAGADWYWRNLIEITPTQLRDAMHRWIDPNRFVRVTVAPGG
jgi:zinc protease